MKSLLLTLILHLIIVASLIIVIPVKAWYYPPYTTTTSIPWEYHGYCQMYTCVQLQWQIDEFESQECSTENYYSSSYSGGGFSMKDLRNAINESIEWLNNKNPLTSGYTQDIGNSLNSYFVSRNEYNKLVNKVSAMQSTFEDIDTEGIYCRAYVTHMIKDYGEIEVTCNDMIYSMLSNGNIISIST